MCSCKYWRRFSGLPCGHILWAYHKTEQPFPLSGIHYRYYIQFEEKPEAFPVRSADDLTVGPATPARLPQLLGQLGEELEAEDDIPGPPIDSDSDDDQDRPRYHEATESTRISRLIAPLVEEVWGLAKVAYPVAEQLHLSVSESLLETREWCRGKYHIPDTATVEDQLFYRSQNKRAGAAKKK